MAEKHEKASRTKVIAVHGHLQRVLRKLDNGLCEYLDSHSDRTVADAEDVSVNSVAGLRLEMFGKLRSQGAAVSEGVRADLAALRERHEALRRDHVDLVDRFNKLITNLSLNKVGDVRHLAVPART